VSKYSFNLQKGDTSSDVGKINKINSTKPTTKFVSIQEYVGVKRQQFHYLQQRRDSNGVFMPRK